MGCTPFCLPHAALLSAPRLTQREHATRPRAISLLTGSVDGTHGEEAGECRGGVVRLLVITAPSATDTTALTAACHVRLFPLVLEKVPSCLFMPRDSS